MLLRVIFAFLALIVAGAGLMMLRDFIRWMKETPVEVRARSVYPYTDVMAFAIAGAIMFTLLAVKGLPSV